MDQKIHDLMTGQEQQGTSHASMASNTISALIARLNRIAAELDNDNVPFGSVSGDLGIVGLALDVQRSVDTFRAARQVSQAISASER